MTKTAYRCRNGTTIICEGEISRDRLINGATEALKMDARMKRAKAKSKAAPAGQGCAA